MEDGGWQMENGGEDVSLCPMLSRFEMYGADQEL
jgi:hypothetical protein